MNAVCGSVSRVIDMYTSVNYLDCSGRLDFILNIIANWWLEAIVLY